MPPSFTFVITLSLLPLPLSKMYTLHGGNTMTSRWLKCNLETSRPPCNFNRGAVKPRSRGAACGMDCVRVQSLDVSMAYRIRRSIYRPGRWICEAGCGEMHRVIALVLNSLVPRWSVEFCCIANVTGQSHGFIVVSRGSLKSNGIQYAILQSCCKVIPTLTLIWCVL